MYISQKIELILTDTNRKELDKESYLATMLYNELVRFADKAIGDKTSPKYITRNELFNKCLEIQNRQPNLGEINYSSISGLIYKLDQALQLFYKKQISFPKYKSFKLQWMDLFFNNKYKNIVIKGKSIKITLGNKNPKRDSRKYLNAKLKYKLRRHKEIYNYRIIKIADKYYLVITMEAYPIEPLPKTNVNVAIDMNHSNFFVAIDSKGTTIEFEKPKISNIYNSKLDALKTKRDKNHVKELTRANGSPFLVYSNKYHKYNKIIQKLFFQKKQDTKRFYYMVANYLIKSYDIIAIGDYTPNVSDTINTQMRRSMINDTGFNEFRETLEYVAEKYGKKVIIINENNTTSKCFFCGHFKAKDPTVRDFICPQCHRHIYRDINSAINIGMKAGLFNKSLFFNSDLSSPKYKMFYHFHKQKLIKYKQ